MSYIASSELDKEIVLDPAIQPLPGELNLNPQPQAVLVTGVTGFIAAFLIAELLETTPAQIYGFVRANDVDHGMARIRENMERYALWRPEYQQRIIPVPGDLKKPLLGLEPQYFQYLAETVEAIYHSGSKLSYIAPYGFLKAANVGGTEEALRLATTGRAKPFHFISSLGILLNYKALVGGQEDAPLDCNKCPEVGYFQTKYVAEGLTRLARDRGIPVTIHRIGLIVGDSRSGLSNFDDFVSRIILGCIEAGDAPDIHTAMDMTPVDYIAKAIIYLSFNKAALGNVFHLLNPNPITWSDVFESVIRAGYAVNKQPFQQWLEAVEEHEDPNTNPLHPLLPFFHIDFAGRMLGVSDSAYNALGREQTQTALAGADFVCAPVDDKLVAKYLDGFVRIGKLNVAKTLPVKTASSPTAVQTAMD